MINHLHSEETLNHKIEETFKMFKGKDKAGRKVVNQYTIIKTLGKGGFAKVKLAKEIHSHEFFAIKIVKKQLLKKKIQFFKSASKGCIKTDAFQSVLKEIAIMKKLQHKNVVRLYEIIDDPESEELFMIMDYAERGQILEWNNQEERFYFTTEHSTEYLGEKYLKKIFIDILQGLSYLHENGVIHRDLKPQNILLDEHGNAKIADFGLSVVIEATDLLSNSVGTSYFMPPECCKANLNQQKFSGRKADIWSLGVTLFALVFKDVPFKGENIMDVFENIKSQDLAIPKTRTISTELKELLRRLLEKDPEQRISLNEIFECSWIMQKKHGLSVVIDVSEMEINSALLSSHTILLNKRSLNEKEEQHNFNFIESPKSDGDIPSCTPLRRKPSFFEKELSEKAIFAAKKYKSLFC